MGTLSLLLKGLSEKPTLFPCPCDYLSLYHGNVKIDPLSSWASELIEWVLLSLFLGSSWDRQLGIGLSGSTFEFCFLL